MKLFLSLMTKQSCSLHEAWKHRIVYLENRDILVVFSITVKPKLNYHFIKTIYLCWLHLKSIVLYFIPIHCICKKKKCFKTCFKIQIAMFKKSIGHWCWNALSVWRVRMIEVDCTFIAWIKSSIFIRPISKWCC